VSAECLNTFMSSIVIILTNLAKIGSWRTRWLWTVAPGCCHFQSFFSYLWTGCPELLYPHLLPSPHLQHRAAPSFPTSLPPSLHFTLFTSAHLTARCPAQSSVWGANPLEAHLTPLCLSRICTWDCKKKNPESERGDIC